MKVKKRVNKKFQRPILVTIMCIFGFIGVPLSLIFAFMGMSAVASNPVVNSIPLWYSIFTAVLALIYFPTLIFIWKMRKSGLIAFTVLAAIDYLVGFIFGFADVTGFIVSVVVLILFYTQFNKMT